MLCTWKRLAGGGKCKAAWKRCPCWWSGQQVDHGRHARVDLAGQRTTPTIASHPVMYAICACQPANRRLGYRGQALHMYVHVQSLHRRTVVCQRVVSASLCAVNVIYVLAATTVASAMQRHTSCVNIISGTLHPPLATYDILVNQCTHAILLGCRTICAQGFLHSRSAG